MTRNEAKLIAVNASGINPTEYKVLILPLEVSDKIGSIIVPDSKKDQDQFAQIEGTLIACSPLAFSYDDWKGADHPKQGDRVLFAKYAGTTRKGKDGKDYRIINDKDIWAVVT